MDDDDVLKIHILQKLVRGSAWGGKHTPLDFISGGLPTKYRNTHKGKKELEKAIKNFSMQGG